MNATAAGLVIALLGPSLFVLILLSVLSVGPGGSQRATPITHALAAIFLLHFFEPLITRWLTR